ncbi:MAG: VanZ family protein, partial [Gammaproteobacteria bacterium]
MAPRNDALIPSRRLFYAGLAYLAFVIYGSLVPLDFHYHPFAEAWRSFTNIPYLRLGVASRADWVANILLYIPLGFIGAALLGSGSRSFFGSLIAALLVFAFSAAIAVGVEFTQQFFPPRTVSLNDLIAELLGAASGILLWQVSGKRLTRLGIEVAVGGVHALRALMVLYALGYLTVSLFPYDFLVSASEISWKLAHTVDSLSFWPASCNSRLLCLIKLMAEAVAVLPLGALFGKYLAKPRNGLFSALLLGALLGLAIETLQFFLASGITEGVSVLTRAVGVAAGLVLFNFASVANFSRFKIYLRPAVLLMLPIYLLGLAVVSGWFSADWIGIEQALAKLDTLRFIPFYYHYYTSETTALRSLLVNVAMYLPAGIGYWAWTQRGVDDYGNAGGLRAGLLGAFIALLMESGRLFLEAKRPDPTDLLIAALAAGFAYTLANMIAHWLRQAPDKMSALKADVMVHHITKGLDLGRMALRTLALFAAAVIPAALLYYPLKPAWLAAALILYGLVLWQRPALWLIVIPALLPALDLAPWSGWFFLDEFDLFILVTLAIGLWRLPGDWNTGMSKASAALFLFAVASYAISALIGLFPWQTLDANAFSNYYSHYNALRLLKGFVWAAALLPLWLHAAASGVKTEKHFTVGIALGLFLAGMVALWERLLFPGLFDFTSDYRISAAFSGMHVGGAYLDGYLNTALPFVALWLITTQKLWARGAAMLIFCLGSYTLLVTYSRGAYLGFAVAAVIFGVAAILQAIKLSGTKLSKAATVSALAIARGTTALATGTVFKGGYIQARFDQTAKDLDIRSAHWRDALRMMDQGWRTQWFGMGLGRYPGVYSKKNSEGVTPATYRYETENGNTFLRLYSGDALFLNQAVALNSRQNYLLSFDARSTTPGAELSAPVCEKWVLYSYRCVEINKAISSPRWEKHAIVFNSGETGAGGFPRRP